ncbi:mitotic spindle assembly checkpoint protein MAD2A-like [Helicoverpa zea]|uniref:mitotic spindle assembly checkpoint protein MAD2A-like n=1 Tax=Helicoverpa zea TaxID=7113 RepID=UPI001F5ACF1A|nr:mitotic spindle assembly checkpoint protein MAD2A-like [Helicoverpa zea]
MSQQQTKNCITLQGSAQIICEYLKFAINSVLFQRGLCSPETFKTEQQYGITLLLSEDAEIKSFLTKVLAQTEEWILNKKISKLSLVIFNVANEEILECWDFNLQYEDGDAALSKENNETIGSKDLKQIQQKIREVMLQVAATISYLPFLDSRCSFDFFANVKADCDVPENWTVSEPVFIANAQNVPFKIFSTSLHKMETVVSYKFVD